MWIETILTARDCADFVASITPLRVDLGEDRALVIERPKTVEIVPDKGLRLQTAGYVAWKVARMKVPVAFRVASLLLQPSVEKRKGRDALCFRARIEELDVKVLPNFADESLLDRINDRLAEQDDLLVWRFVERLDFHMAMPERIESPHAIHIRTKWGQVKITAEALVLAISLEMRGEDVPLRAPRPAAAVVAP